ncbi:MAG: hypothetical protein FWG81_11665, partial [Betaproteobacteria bacterium]|nr:hypothetical protein [Betaproteobacteria bacterium]
LRELKQCWPQAHCCLPEQALYIDATGFLVQKQKLTTGASPYIGWGERNANPNIWEGKQSNDMTG